MVIVDARRHHRPRQRPDRAAVRLRARGAARQARRDRWCRSVSADATRATAPATSPSRARARWASGSSSRRGARTAASSRSRSASARSRPRRACWSPPRSATSPTRKRGGEVPRPARIGTRRDGHRQPRRARSSLVNAQTERPFGYPREELLGTRRDPGARALPHRHRPPLRRPRRAPAWAPGSSSTAAQGRQRVPGRDQPQPARDRGGHAGVRRDPRHHRAAPRGGKSCGTSPHSSSHRTRRSSARRSTAGS